MPTMEGTEDKLYAIPGSPPDLLDPPTGDAFYPRNEFALKLIQKKNHLILKYHRHTKQQRGY